MKVSFLAAVLTLALAANFCPSMLQATSTNTKSTKTASATTFQEINSADLKKLIDSKTSVVILDARKKLSGGLLPGAKQLPYTAEDKEVAKVLGSTPKNATIVVYCANIDCPVSKYLAEKLVSLGYTNVYKYPQGIAEWIAKGYPVDPIK